MKRSVKHSVYSAQLFFCAFLWCSFQSGSVLASGAPIGDAIDRPALEVIAPNHELLVDAVRAGERIIAVGERGIIAYSDNDGESWAQAVSPVSVTLTGVRFADEYNGVAVGNGGVVVTTKDSGKTWEKKLDGRAIAKIALDEASSNGYSRDVKDAQRLVAEGADKPLLDVAVFDAQRFVVIGAYGTALTTDDGGRHWRYISGKLPNRTSLHLNAIVQEAGKMLVVGEQGMVIYSPDQGKTFQRLNGPYEGSLFSAHLGKDGEIYVGGLGGRAWRSNDAGVTWTELDAAGSSTIVSIINDFNSNLLFVSQSGVVFREGQGALIPFERTYLSGLTAALPTEHGLLLFGLHGVSMVSESEVNQ